VIVAGVDDRDPGSPGLPPVGEVWAEELPSVRVDDGLALERQRVQDAVLGTTASVAGDAGDLHAEHTRTGGPDAVTFEASAQGRAD
jgi:hypothetical protein